MRVGRPVKALPQLACDYCGGKARVVRDGEESYPYREDHGRVWMCHACDAWIGVFARSRHNVPLGRLANADLRAWKARLHAAFEPLVAAKVRRDGCNPFAARAHGYRWLACQLKLEEKSCQIHLLDAAQCQAAIEIIRQFERGRNANAPASGEAVDGASLAEADI